jgi:anti-anti-sigma factor
MSDMNRIFGPAVIGLACLAAAASIPTLQEVPGCIRADVWPVSLIAFHAITDGLIALAYTWIPIALIFVWRARKDIPLNWTLLCFAAFIVLCGATHVMGIVTIWRPVYWFSGEIKAATALVSVMTAALLSFRVSPILLAIPKADDLRAAVERAEREAAAAREAAGRVETTQAELATANVKLSEVNQRLELAVRELSTPVLEIERGILLVPIIGSLDSNRARLLMETVGAEVSARRARSILLDLTGVRTVDTAVADFLMRTASIVKLLGARCLATGIQPGVARTLVELGVDVAIPTRGSLAQGLALAIAERDRGEDARRR